MIKIRKVDKLQNAIDDLLDEMKNHTGDTEEYSKMADQLTKLNEAQVSKGTSSLKLKETALVVAGNLTGILAIVHYEQLGVVTSKALNLVIKSKI